MHGFEPKSVSFPIISSIKHWSCDDSEYITSMY
jgi:hypothetical protein